METHPVIASVESISQGTNYLLFSLKVLLENIFVEEDNPLKVAAIGQLIMQVGRLKPATLLKLSFLHGCFSRFLNCTNGTKSGNAPHIVYEDEPKTYDTLWKTL